MDDVTATIGKALPHDSARRHVTGTALYTDDTPLPAGTLHLAPGYSPDVARGRFEALDLTAVRASEGVVAVLTAIDIPGHNDCSPSIGGDPILSTGEINFHGQVLFLVVATSHLAARKAAKKAKITIADKQKPAISIEDARERGETVLPPFTFLKGDPDKVTAKHRLTLVQQIGGQEHFYLEGQVAYAFPAIDGQMKVVSSTQHPSEVQHIVSHMLHWPSACVNVEIRRMGGGFGGKESQASQWAALAALAAFRTGKPCKIRLDRDDDMIMTGKRHDFLTETRVDFDENGAIQAVDMDMHARCGCSADLSLGVVDRAMFHADNAYHYPASRITSHRWRTDTVSNTAFRGFGGPKGVLAAECVQDAIAITLGLDPLEVRKRNLYAPQGQTTPYGMEVFDNILPELLAELEESCGYQARSAAIKAYNAKGGLLRKGIALTPLKFGISFTLPHLNQAGALVHVYADGSVQVNHGGTEMGQGLNTKVAMVVAEEFGLPLDAIQITPTATDKVPNTSPTAASSGSDLNGMAALNAASAIRARMAEQAAHLLGSSVNDVSFHDGKVTAGGKSLSFADLAKACYVARVSLSQNGFYSTPGITWNRDAKTGNPFYYFAYGAACAEVTIDTLTGETKVNRIDVLHDVGHSLNPALDKGQIEGGLVQGMGWLTTEELVFDGQGRLRTHAPSTYKIPTATDVPEAFTVRLFDGEGCKRDTVYRSKAVGEPPLMLATCVYSAIYHAVASLKPGALPVLDAPATPEAILRAIQHLEGRA